MLIGQTLMIIVSRIFPCFFSFHRSSCGNVSNFQLHTLFYFSTKVHCHHSYGIYCRGHHAQIDWLIKNTSTLMRNYHIKHTSSLLLRLISIHVLSFCNFIYARGIRRYLLQTSKSKQNIRFECSERNRFLHRRYAKQKEEHP